MTIDGRSVELVELKNGSRFFFWADQAPKWKPLLRRNSFDEPFAERLVGYGTGPKGAIAVDAGAHVGVWTTHLAKRCEFVIAFEPCPSSIILWRENMKLNGIKNAVLIPKALSETKGRASLDVDAASDGQYCIRPYTRFRGSVPVTTLDDELRKVKVDFLKMDVEGEEFLALQGATNTLKALIAMYIEIDPGRKDSKGVGGTIRARRLLKRRGFRCDGTDGRRNFFWVKKEIENAI